jgi:molecular chaperone GrpE
VTSKGAAQPNRPETAPPSDGGAVSAGAAADESVDSGATAAPPSSAEKSQGDKPPAGTPDRSGPDGNDEATAATDNGDSTIDLEVTLPSTDETAVDTDAAGATDGSDNGARGKTPGDKGAEDKATDVASAERADDGVVNTDGKENDVHESKTAEDIEAAGGDQPDDDGQPFDKELETLRSDLGELTRDLQRITAEYANYRKRVDRDRMLTAEQATGAVLTQLLPVLDDLDRARDHGDLVGPFGSVAEQLVNALTKFGLTAFGAPGDPFDPTLHEAVSHTSSPDVTETTCVEIMRRGYQLGDRMLRPALVGVADPE